MKLFKKLRKKSEQDALEWRLDTISNLTKGLGKKEFNALIEATKAMYEARSKLTVVKSDDEKEIADIDSIEKTLTNQRKENYGK